MERQPVKSSNIASIGYDPETKRLQVEFRNSKDARLPGRVYEYSGITPAQHHALIHSGSVGSYFAAHIKGHHAGTLQNGKA